MQLLCISSNVTGHLARSMVHQLNKYWPEHPPIIVGGYDKPPLQDSVQFYRIGNWSDYPVDKWSDGLIKFIREVAEDNFILTFDDFISIAPVPHNLVMELWKYFLVNAWLSRLDLTDDRAKSGYAVDAGTLPYVDNDGNPRMAHLCTTTHDSPYALSFQTGIWNKRSLLRYLVPGETPAQAEIRGAHRMSQARENVAGTYDAPLRYLIAMQHGKNVIPGPGYQAADSVLPESDYAELIRLGYLP